MIDLIESKLARQEFEQRVRTYTPVQTHDARLTDDRQLTVYPIRSGVVGVSDNRFGWVSRGARRLLSAITTRLDSLEEQLEVRRNSGHEMSPSDPEHNGLAL
jgi:hypothetical protein